MLEDTRFMSRIDYVIYGKSPFLGDLRLNLARKIPSAMQSIQLLESRTTLQWFSETHNPIACLHVGDLPWKGDFRLWPPEVAVDQN